MSRLPQLFLVVAVGLAAIGALSASPGDEAAVRAFMERFSGSWERGEDLARFYAANATHIGAEGDWVRQPDGFAISPGLDVASVSFLAERVALVGGTFARRGEGRSERYAFVLKRTDAGWKIAGSRIAPAEGR